MPINSVIGLPGTIPVDSDSTSSSSSSSSTGSTRPVSVSRTSSPLPTMSTIVDVPAPNLPSSSSPSLTSSAATETTAAASSQVTTTAQANSTPAGSIAGLVIGLLLLVGLLLFGVRWFFIRKREHKTTPARSRISRLNISGPSNFTHLQSGAAVGMAGTLRTPGGPAHETAAPSSAQVNRSITATTDPNSAAAAASPYDRIKQKYSFDLNQLETGLSDHMETMKTSRKNAPSH